jgi:hypothetical protein
VFKKGDVVVCVRPERYRLTEGKRYTVLDTHTYGAMAAPLISLHDDQHVGGWDPDRFISAEAAAEREAAVTASIPVPDMAPPRSSAERKGDPLYDGCFAYFPAALALVARLSRKGNDKHNPGEPVHWARGKSTDHNNCELRHMLDAAYGGMDENGMDHRVAKAWRALADLQEAAEREYGWPKAPGAKE